MLSMYLYFTIQCYTYVLYNNSNVTNINAGIYQQHQVPIYSEVVQCVAFIYIFHTTHCSTKCTLYIVCKVVMPHINCIQICKIYYYVMRTYMLYKHRSLYTRKKNFQLDLFIFFFFSN